MDKQTFLDTISQIGTCEDEVQRREMLATLSEEATARYDEIASLTETNNTLTTDNEELRSANMKLFKRIGNPTTEAERIENETGSHAENKEPRKFEDLFDEKGVLK